MTGAGQQDLDLAYRGHAGAVFRRARRILGTAHEAEEIVSEIFESLAVDDASLSRAASPAGWFCATTTNRCINRLRDAKNRLRLLRENASAPPQQPTTAEDAATLRQLLRGLPEELAKVAVYYYGDEMSHEEIARLLDCSRRHVGDLVMELHRKVREMEKA